MNWVYYKANHLGLSSNLQFFILEESRNSTKTKTQVTFFVKTNIFEQEPNNSFRKNCSWGRQLSFIYEGYNLKNPVVKFAQN